MNLRPPDSVKHTYQRVARRLSRPGRSRRFFLAYCAAIILVYAIFVPGAARPGFRVWGPGDFTAFYTAAHIIRAGDAHRLYDVSVQTQVQQTFLLPHGWIFSGGLLPYINPPFFAAFLIPLSFLPLAWAFHAWNILNITLILVTIELLLRRHQRSSSRDFVAACLVAFSFFPVLQALLNGQNSFLLLFVLALVYLALKSNRDHLAGVTLAGGLIKPQLVIVVAVMMVYRRRWRTVFAFSITSIGLLLASWMIVGTGGMTSYVELIRQMNRSGVYDPHPEVMSNLRGTVYRSGQLYHTWSETELPPVISGAVLLSLSAFVLALVLRMWKEPWNPTSPEFDLRFGQTVIGSLLLSPHLYDHDLILLILVGFLLANYYAHRARNAQVYGMIAAGHAILLISALAMGIVGKRAQIITFLLISLMIILQNEVQCKSQHD